MKILADQNMPLVEEYFSDFGEIERFDGRQLHPAQLIDVDVLLTRSVTNVDRNLLAQANKLSFVGTATIGIDHIDTQLLQDKNIAFTSAPGCNAIAVAEYVISSLYALSQENAQPVCGQTIGIVGVGNIGTCLAQKLKALNVNVLLCDPIKHEQGLLDNHIALDELLSQSDVVTFHVPLVKSGKHKTLHMMNKKRLNALKSGTIVINASRGDVIDNQALLEVMQSGAELDLAGEIRDAHKPQTWTSGIDISSDGRMVVTRGGDDLIKLWDTRKFTKPLVTVSHTSTSDHYSTSNIKYAPNSTSIITGSITGHLHILNPGNLRAEHVTPITPGSPLITVDWHPKINQIITGSANAETHVLYNPQMSSKGAVDVMSRAPKKRHIDDNPELTMDQSVGVSGDAIMVPGATAGSRRSGVTVSGRSKDPRRPHIPQQTPMEKNAPDEKAIAENIPLARMLHEDPREALLKYADKAQSNPMFTKAWAQNQPETQYADLSDEEDGPDKKRLKR